jgi:D-alanyl-D-alanine dipeptidase
MRLRSLPYLTLTLAVLLARANGPAVAQSSGVDSIFRITPMRPVAELRKEALAAKPPKETGDFRQPDLVELITLDPTIKLDIRYATADNFLSTPMYSQSRAFLQRPAAEALVRASHALRAKGYGLLIYDGYRPWYVTDMFWEATPNDKKIFVADPKDGSRHNRGCAVDLTLYDLNTGATVKMPSGYDEMSERAFADYAGGTPEERGHRAILRAAMDDQGFTVYPQEWWHFDYKDSKYYRILNVRFEDLVKK